MKPAIVPDDPRRIRVEGGGLPGFSLFSAINVIGWPAGSGVCGTSERVADLCGRCAVSQVRR